MLLFFFSFVFKLKQLDAEEQLKERSTFSEDGNLSSCKNVMLGDFIYSAAIKGVDTFNCKGHKL